jgi:hypothetical protein
MQGLGGFSQINPQLMGMFPPGLNPQNLHMMQSGGYGGQK